MKQNIFLILFSAMGFYSYCQVGIGTENPSGIFHIDGSQDNPATGTPNASQQNNDFIVTPEGNTGIGTTTPTRKLEIVTPTSPALRI